MFDAASINSMVYGLNAYSLRLEVVVAEALAARQQRTDEQSLDFSQSPAQAIQTVYQNGDTPPPSSREVEPGFERMFRAVAVKEPA
jgi:hypothetical protein